MKITVLCTLSTGLFAIRQVLNAGIKIYKVIGLNPNNFKDNKLFSGFVDIKFFCLENKLSYAYVNDYTLKTEDPLQLLKETSLLWVCGWQRLVPESFFHWLEFGAIGAHGSCDGITLGRGRSPQNWALLIGAKKFEISVFRISSEIDDGSIISSNAFDLKLTDNIQTSYIKVGISVAKCLTEIYYNPTLIENAKPQTGSAEYFPKRIPSDGNIDWNMSVHEIHNQIRALADPYPNARTFLDGEQILIKRSNPILCLVNYRVGEIVSVPSNGELLVAAKNGYLLIEEYKSNLNTDALRQGRILESKNMKIIIQKVFNRFEREFPNKKLNSTLIEFWKSLGIEI